MVPHWTAGEEGTSDGTTLDSRGGTSDGTTLDSGGGRY